jgi:transposase-like protein
MTPPTPKDEEWRPVVGFEQKYEVSSIGRVRSIARFKRKSRELYRIEPNMLTPTKNKGYPCVVLTGITGSRTAKVHHLVLEAFVGPRPEGMITRHLNGVRDDNRVENLAWGTFQENSDDMRQHGTKCLGRAVPGAKLNEEAVRDILTGRLSVLKFAALYGVNPTTVDKVRQGLNWRHALPPESPLVLSPRRGTQCNPKLTEAQVREVLQSTERNSVIARRLGVSKDAIERIRARTAWKHVEAA